MKKILAISLFCLLLSSFSFAAYAEAPARELDDVSFIIDFEPAEFNGNAILANGRMLLPMRDFFESIGADLDWCDQEKQVNASYNGNQITLKIEKHTAYINDNMLILDVAPTLVSDATYIPVRFAAESLGYEIIWSDSLRTIYAFSETEDLDLSFIPEQAQPVEEKVPALNVVDTFSGTASWYGGKFHGRRTTSGEVFDQYAMTAAHRTLPFGTFVKVTHKATDDSVVVKINDRGPHIHGRIIDLSMASADKIGLRARGLGEVIVEVLKNYQPK